MPSDIITEKLLRDGSLKVTEVEVEDALESMMTYTNKQHTELNLLYTQRCRNIYRICLPIGSCLFAMFVFEYYFWKYRECFLQVFLSLNNSLLWQLHQFEIENCFIFCLFSANCPKPVPCVLVCYLHPHYSSHIPSVSDDRWCVWRRDRCQCLSHDLREPGGHWGEETQQVGNKQQQIWTRICKKAQILFF